MGLWGGLGGSQTATPTILGRVFDNVWLGLLALVLALVLVLLEEDSLVLFRDAVSKSLSRMLGVVVVST